MQFYIKLIGDIRVRTFTDLAPHLEKYFDFLETYQFGKKLMSTVAASSLCNTTQDNSPFNPTLFHVFSLN